MSRTSQPARPDQGSRADSGDEEFWTEICWRDVWTPETGVVPAHRPSWGPREPVGTVEAWGPADTAARVVRAEWEAMRRERCRVAAWLQVRCAPSSASTTGRG